MTRVLNFAARSHAGHVRTNNEDSAYASPRIVAVADGVGGHTAGEVASALAIREMQTLENDLGHRDIDSALRASVLRANHAIRRAIERDDALEGMATTLTALQLLGSHIGLVHLGDSRAYLLRDGHLSQLTRDDTLVQALVDDGTITARQARKHPQRSVIAKALKGEWVEPTVWIREAHHGERYLLCTDGLTDSVSIADITHALRHARPQECADELVEIALRAGARDNVTVAVADICTQRDLVDVDSAPIAVGACQQPHAAS